MMSTANSNDVVISKDSDSVPDPTCKSFEIDEEDPSKVTTEEDADTRTKGFVVIVAAAVALGGMIFGYDIGGAGTTFVMKGFRTYFGWDCPENDETCVPATQSEIDTDQGLVNGLFGAGAAIGAITAIVARESEGPFDSFPGWQKKAEASSSLN